MPKGESLWQKKRAPVDPLELGFVAFRIATSQVTTVSRSFESNIFWLVVEPYPSEKYESQWGWDYPIYELVNKKCSKPPTSILAVFFHSKTTKLPTNAEFYH